MIRRFFPLWFPAVLIVVVSAVNFIFWRVDTVGKPMTVLPSRTLAGHAVSLSRPTSADPLTEPCMWMAHLSPAALAALGGLEIAYSAAGSPPLESDWCRVPTGGSQDAFRAAPPWSSRPAQLWLRGKIPGGGREPAVSWQLSPAQ